MKTFVPSKHPTKLPASDVSHEEDPELYHISLRNVACHVYWRRVKALAKKEKVGILKARELFHATGTLPTRRAEREAAGDESFWHHEDLITKFMLQFPDWQSKRYDMQKMHESDQLGANWEIGKNNTKMTLEQYVSIVDTYTLNNLPSYLRYCNRFDDMKSLFDDPIFGDDMQFEFESHERSQDFAINEVLRVAQSHEHLQEIDAIIRTAGPSNYHVHYPWGPYGECNHTLENPPRDKDGKPYPPYHTVPNCLNVGADGSPVFRLQVLDTEGFTRYKLADLKKPWWGMNAPLGKSPKNEWEGEYDFDFHHFMISEGDELTHEKLLEVLRHGVERIATRGKRKYGGE